MCMINLLRFLRIICLNKLTDGDKSDTVSRFANQYKKINIYFISIL